MSAGHKHKRTLTTSELNDLLDHALADKRIKACLAQPFKLIGSKDIPLLGSSAIDGDVYIDQHLRMRGLAHGILIVDGRKLNARQGLTRHERMERCCEDILGWTYDIAHAVATHYEERLYRELGFDPRDVEQVYAPFIRNDESEPLPRVPLDLDLRPMLHDKKLLARVRSAQDKQRRTKPSVSYTDRSVTAQHCSSCRHFISKKFGGTSCTGVAGHIEPSGWCVRFSRGALDKQQAA